MRLLGRLTLLLLAHGFVACGPVTPPLNDEQRAQVIAHRQAMREMLATVSDDFETPASDEAPGATESPLRQRLRERVGDRSCRVTRQGIRVEIAGESGCGFHMVRRGSFPTSVRPTDPRLIREFHSSLRLQLAILDGAFAAGLPYSRLGLNVELLGKPGDSETPGQVDGWASLAVETPQGLVRWSREVILRGGLGRDSSVVHSGSVRHKYEFSDFTLEARIDYLVDATKYRLNGREVSRDEFASLVSEWPDEL